MNLYTIGFSKKSAEEFFYILKLNKVAKLIDVRLNNKSQLAGFTNVKHLPYFLKLHDIEYLHKPEFAPSKELLNGYKSKSISWEEYEVEYDKLIIQRKIVEKINWDIFKDAVLLCSEVTAEMCHRRLLAEYFAKNNNEIKIKHL